MAELLELDLIINAANSAKTVGELRQSLKDINSELNKAEAGSASYNKLVTAAGKVKAELTDLKQEIKALDPDATAASFGKAIRGIAGGFQAATAAAALFGVESEDLQKSLLKVQAAMALSAAIKDVQDLGDAFKILNTIIKANPILFIIAGLAALGVAIVAITEKYFKWSSTVDNLQAQLDEQKKIEEEIVRITNNQITALEGVVGSEREILLLRKQQIEEQLKTIQVSIALNQQKLKEIATNDTLLDSITKLFGGETAYRVIKANNIKEQNDLLEKDKKSLEELTALLTKSTTQITNFDKSEQDKRIKQHEDSIKKKKDLDDAAFNTYIEDLKARFQTEQDEMKRQQMIIDGIDAEEKAKEKTDAEERDNNPLIVGSKAFVAKQHQDFLAEVERDQALSSAKLAVQDAYINAIGAGFGILQGFANKNKQLQNVFFGIEKAVAAANVFINMRREIGAINTKYALIPGGQAIALAETTAARIRGFSSIAQILATTIQKFIGGSGGAASSGGGGGGITATGGASQGVPINPVSNASTLLNPDGTVKTEPNPNDQRVYVLETDISRTQNKITSIENKAKIE